MALERLKIADLEKWGNLVKKWATGAKPRPGSLEEFKNQCVAEGVGATVPSYVTDIELVQTPTITRLLIRLPPKELVEDSEAVLKAGTNYTIPDFYNDFYKRPGEAASPQPDIPNDEASKLKVHALRIGDYTMANCL